MADSSNASKSLWRRTKSSSKAGFDKVYNLVDKAGAPINRFTHKLGSEAFWPTTLDKESEKAARILRSFCKDGFYQEELYETGDGPKQKQRVIKKIPPEVIQNAKGLAIFTTMRTGLWVSGAGGSGILIGRTEDGSWSPPSGIMLHTAGLGFLVGVDIYDCVLVLNTQDAVNAFAKWRCTIGGEMSATTGPVGVGGVLESEVHKRQAPIFTYLKSRGFYAGVQVDGTVIIERTDENERFYRERISATDIVAGKIRHPPIELKMLFETLKAAQGDKNVNQEYLPTEPPPADYQVEEEGHTFGIPDKDDPDPYGVLALEKEGLAIKEASSKIRASTDEFDFNPRLSSPIYTSYRRSWDNDSSGGSTRESWRRSTLSSLERRYVTADSSTQTELESSSATYTNRASYSTSPVRTPINEEESSHSDNEGMNKGQANGTHESSQKMTAVDEDDDEEENFHEVQQAAAPQVIRAKVVQVPKRIPPKLPPRNPNRSNSSMQTDIVEPTNEQPPNNAPNAALSVGSDASAEPVKSISSIDESAPIRDDPVSPISSSGNAPSVTSVKSKQPSPEPAETSNMEIPQAILDPDDDDTIKDVPTSSDKANWSESTATAETEGGVDEKPLQSHVSLANIRTDLNSDDEEQSDASPVNEKHSQGTHATYKH